MPSITDLLDTMDYGPSPESDAQAQAWLDGHGRSFGHFINGRWFKPRGGKRFASVNPATGQALAQVAQGTPAVVDQAVQAAQAALPGWQALGAHGRARHLYALARALQKHARLLAVLETLDNGKPIRESRDADVPLAVRHFYHHAGWAQLLDDEFPQHQALGVVGQIVPWNFPLLMLAWKVAPALACGNTIVFKPAEQTSLTALLFAELCTEVGLPAGVFNLVSGDGAVGQALTTHPGVTKIAFTGSTEVGRAIRTATAGSGKKLSLELGGKSPYLVFADADLDAAVEGLVDSIFFNQGQVCCAGSQLLVHEGTADALLARLRNRMARIRVGSPLDKNTDMGALVSPEQLARVAGFVDRARAEGATVHQASAAALPGTGCFFAPTLVTGVDTASEIVQDEVFGPVLTVQTFRTPAEAVDLANHTRYGLAASVWTESISLALEVAPRLKAGVVWVNSANQFDAACGFGGYRESGFGREGGREGLIEYLKPVVSNVGSNAPAAPRKAAAAARKTGPALNHAVVETGDEAGDGADAGGGAVDRTPKLYIGGKQVRPDGGYSREIRAGRRLLGVVPEGNRKDIRNAVEAARAAAGWERNTAHGRAQVLYYLAENLHAQRARLAALLVAAGASAAAADAELQASVSSLFSAAAWADKFDGAVHQPPVRGVTLALHEPMGIVGVVAPDDQPLLGLLQLVAPALAQGNRVVAVPSRTLPLVAAELYALLDTSDVPGGVLNLVTGPVDELARTLAGHTEVDAFWWPSATAEQAAVVQALSAHNLKRTWVADTYGSATCREQAVQVKNVWAPYGV